MSCPKREDRRPTSGKIGPCPSQQVNLGMHSRAVVMRGDPMYPTEQPERYHYNLIKHVPIYIDGGSGLLRALYPGRTRTTPIRVVSLFWVFGFLSPSARLVYEQRRPTAPPTYMKRYIRCGLPPPHGTALYSSVRVSRLYYDRFGIMSTSLWADGVQTMVRPRITLPARGQADFTKGAGRIKWIVMTVS